jgi:hypothetical protein
MMKHTMHAALLALLVGACGGEQATPETPDDALTSGGEDTGNGDASGDASGDGETTDASDGGETSDANDGIVRDADGDKKPDAATDCKSKNETQCKISSACAWSDDGKCVEASN